MQSPIVKVEFLLPPSKTERTLFKRRPWIVYFFGGQREDGRRVLRGIRCFRTKRDAMLWALAVYPSFYEDDVPF